MGSDDDFFYKLGQKYNRVATALDQAYERGRAAERRATEQPKRDTPFDISSPHSGSTSVADIIGVMLWPWGVALLFRAMFLCIVEGKPRTFGDFLYLLTPGGWWIGGWIITALAVWGILYELRYRGYL